MYKLVTEEDWQLVFPLDEEMEDYLLGELEENQTTSEDGTVTQNTHTSRSASIRMTRLYGPLLPCSTWMARPMESFPL